MINLGNKMLRERSQTKKATYCMIPFVRNVSIGVSTGMGNINRLLLARGCGESRTGVTVNSCMCVCACPHLVTQSCLTLCDTMDCSLPGSSVHGILQARALECVARPFSRGSSKPRDQTQVSCIAGGFFNI